VAPPFSLPPSRSCALAGGTPRRRHTLAPDRPCSTLRPPAGPLPPHTQNRRSLSLPILPHSLPHSPLSINGVTNAIIGVKPPSPFPFPSSPIKGQAAPLLLSPPLAQALLPLATAPCSDHRRSHPNRPRPLAVVRAAPRCPRPASPVEPATSTEPLPCPTLSLPALCLPRRVPCT
jgi:hypothetical protein